MLLKIVYLLTCRVLDLAVVLFRGDREQVRHEQPAQTRPAAEVPGIARLGVRLAKENPLWGYAGSTAKERNSA